MIWWYWWDSSCPYLHYDVYTEESLYLSRAILLTYLGTGPEPYLHKYVLNKQELITAILVVLEWTSQQVNGSAFCMKYMHEHLSDVISCNGKNLVCFQSKKDLLLF